MAKLLTWLAFALMSWNLAWAAPSTPSPNPPEWTTPLAPFRIAGNLYYVGSKDLASYLIVTAKGNVLINSGTESSVPLIKSAIEQLGFKYADTKVLLISHAHQDHAAGSAQIVKETGARYMVMDGDVPAVESGGKLDFVYSYMTYPPTNVDHVLHDGETVRLADAVLIAHKTPGHTRGCTTWTMKVKDGARTLNVVIVGGWYVTSGYRLVERSTQPDSYPGIAKDYEHMFDVLKSLPCDIFLGAHGSYFDLLKKLDQQKAAPGSEVWIDPQGYQAALAAREQDFRDELRKQQGGAG
jgi:metallo-beta-lactamase class B